MPMIELQFDEADTESQWSDLDKAYEEGKVTETHTLRVLMLPDAMASGAPGVAFRFDFDDGTHAIARVSLGNILSHLVPALRGRLAFLGIDEAGKPVGKPDASKN